MPKNSCFQGQGWRLRSYHVLNHLHCRLQSAKVSQNMMFLVQDGTFLCFQAGRSSASDLTVYVQMVLFETSELKIRLTRIIEITSTFYLMGHLLIRHSHEFATQSRHSVDLAGGKPKRRTAHKPDILCWTFHSLLHNRQSRFDLCNCQFHGQSPIVRHWPI